MPPLRFYIAIVGIYDIRRQELWSSNTGGPVREASDSLNVD